MGWVNSTELADEIARRRRYRMRVVNLPLHDPNARVSQIRGKVFVEGFMGHTARIFLEDFDPRTGVDRRGIRRPESQMPTSQPLYRGLEDRIYVRYRQQAMWKWHDTRIPDHFWGKVFWGTA